jgi:hypothetical protein
MCGHRSRHRYVSERTPEYRARRTSDFRVSQDEREEVVELLRKHAGDGRLELDELEERVESALSARTRRDLDALLADLPDTRRRRRATRVRVVALGSTAAALLPLLAGIAILVAAPPAIDWIGWVVIGWWFFAGLPSAGLGFAWCGHTRRRRSRDTVVV